MASKSAVNSLCIFCLSEIPSDDDDNSKKFKRFGSGASSQAKFLLLLSKYLKFQQFVEGRHRVPLTELRLCQDCSDVGDSFGDLFLQLEAIQLQLNWQLRTLSDKITSSDESPSKVKQFRKQFETPIRNKKKEDWQLEKLGKDISQLRKDLLEHCELSLNPGDQPTPKVSLKRIPENEAKRVKGSDQTPEKTRTVEISDDGSDYEGPPADDNYDDDDDGHVSEIGMDVEQEGFSSPKKIKVEKEDDTPSQHQTSSSSATIPTRKSRRVLLKCSKCSKTFGDQAKFNSHLEFHRQMGEGEQEEEESAEVHQNEQERDDDEAADDFEPDIDDNPPSEDDNDDDATVEKAQTKTKPLTTEKQWVRPNFLPSTKCEVCHQTFVSETAVEKHRVVTHKLEKFIRCQGCGRTFSKFKNLRCHRSHPSLRKCYVKKLKFLEPASVSEFPQYSHGSENKFCPKEGCFEIFAFKEHLEVHLKTHGEWSCSDCEKVFEKAHNLAWHEITEHNEVGSESTDASGEAIYKCNRCLSQKKYKKRWAIYHFLTKHLGISKTLPDNSQTKKQCPICKRPFNVQMSKREIDQHIKMEHDVEGMDPTKVSRCSICDVPFVSQRFLTQHMKLVHKTERTFECSKCGKTFKKTTDLRYHWRSAHKGVPAKDLGLIGDYECHLCNEKFEHKNLLASHVKWHERLEQTFPCKECSKVYTKADTLRRHVQSVHSPDEMMPFCCDTCGKLFGRKDRLVQHVRTHSEQKATFDCNLCGASFKQESKLKSHFESTHGNKVEVEIAVVDPSQIFIVEADN